MEMTDNRAVLLECAKELFYAKGYDAVGVQEIVERAGLTKPTLYYYFGSKIGLLQALLKEKCEWIQTLKHRLEEKDSDIREDLYCVADHFYDFFAADRHFYMLFIALFYSARENEAYQVVKPYITELYELIVSRFERASGQLGNMRGRQRQFAIGFTGTITHYLLLHEETDPRAQKKIDRQTLASVVDQFMYGIFT